jgi:flagellar hook-length control protein FliK
LRLHPESLGEVRVQVRWEGGALSARIEAVTPLAREALESGSHHLRAALEDQGIPVERLSIGMRMDLDAKQFAHDSGWPAEESLLPERAAFATEQPQEEAEQASARSGRVDIRV